MLGQQYTFANLPAECPSLDQNYKLETIISSNNQVYSKDSIQIDDQDISIRRNSGDSSLNPPSLVH